MEAHPIDGFINLLKPPGISSAGAVGFVKRTLQCKKAGHAGTLDPEAAGVLPIMIGKASRLFDVLVDKEKEYIIEIAFGVATDTQDAQGTITARTATIPSLSELSSIIPRFTGVISQVPPAYSAVKIQGKAAYAHARKGEETERAARPARIDSIEIIRQTTDCNFLLRVRCGRGVYMRSLCFDLGNALNSLAHMCFLLRTKSGFFTIDQSCTFDELIERTASLIIPIDQPIFFLPMAQVSEAHAVRLRSGNPMTIFERIDEKAYEGGITRVYCGDAFAGLARWKDGALRFQAMLMEGE
jgi:tRNA pseudouridine55 synthase